MGRFVKGSVVVVNYFFTDLSGSKRRPAVASERDDRVDATVYALTELSTTKRGITAY